MLSICLVCVGKNKENFYLDACDEYVRRLSPYTKLKIMEIPEFKLPDNPSNTQIDNALLNESYQIKKKLPNNSYVISMCVEGDKFDSLEFCEKINSIANSEISRICFVIGGPHGLPSEIKIDSNLKLSVSDRTFAHHLVRVMLLEQIYRSFNILNNGRYHK